MHNFNARHSFHHAWHASARCWFDGLPACSITAYGSSGRKEETAVGVLGISPIGAAIMSLSGMPLPFVEYKAISGALETPLGCLQFNGRILVDTTMKAYIVLEPLDMAAWRNASALATSCVDSSFRAGTVRRVGSVVIVSGALTSALRRDLLDACAQAGILDLAGVCHSTVDGIALCLIARDRFGIQIGRCSDHITWHMRGWTNHDCESFCAQDDLRRMHCRRLARGRVTVACSGVEA